MTNAVMTQVDFHPELRRRLLQDLRVDLTADVAKVVGRSAMLREEALAKDAPHETLGDLHKLYEVSKELYHFVRDVTVADWPEIESDEFTTRLANVRHDIINKLTPPQNICQFLLTVDSSEYWGAMCEDLAAIEAACKACTATLARYKDVTSVVTDVETPPATSAPVEVVPNTTGPNESPVVGAAVLVVDDNPDIRDLLAKFLEKEGHQVTTGGDGREALDLLAKQEFDLVLLDLVMPELSGYQVLKRMRHGSDERLRHTPVIMVSGVTETDHVVACIDAGADDHLPKPPDFRLLRARVNSCLAKRRLREQEFGQFFTPELARHFVRHPEFLKTGRDAEVTIMFCDIRGFSGISERLKPDETVRWLGDVMGAFSDCVIKHRGVLVDYIGDELMAMWGAPEELPNHADLACRAALDIIACLPQLDQRWQSFVQDSTAVGIGVNTGVARVGNTGSYRKFKYGPLGHTVNLASRVQGANKYLGTKLLVTGETYGQLNGDFSSRRLCKVRVRNIVDPVELFELCPPGCDADASPDLTMLKRSEKCDLGDDLEPVWELPGK